jgi:hypothetical protein
VDGDVGPEFTEDIGERVSSNGETVLSGDGPGGAGLRGIIRDRDGLGDAPAKNLRSIEGIMPFIVGRDEDTRSRIDCAFRETALAHGIVAFVLMKKRREDKNDEVVAVGPINETTPVVSAIAGNAFAEFG